MERKNFFERNEIPYEKFELYGLNQDMIDDLPQSVIDKLIEGKWTPPITTNIQSESEVFKVPVRFQLVRTEKDVELMVCAKKSTASLEQFSDEDQNILRDGSPILYQHEDFGNCYAQLDDKTNKVAFSPAFIIQNNLKTLYEKFEIPVEEQPQEVGECITTDKNNLGFPITYGIDLFADNGVRLVYGDKEKWQERKDNNMPKYNFGIFGCWITDDENSLSDYVLEEDYSEEMNNAFQRTAERNVEKAKGLHL